MTSLITALILLLVGIVIVDDSAIKSCCNIAVKHYFTANKNSSGVHNIIDFCQQGTIVQGYCDTLTDGGGWLVIQRKKDGSENFHRYWWEYEMGFSSLTGEFWFGLNALHCLTSQGQWELRIDLKLTNGTIIYLSYKKFAVGPGSEQYPLTISGFTGYTTDPIGTHNQNTMKFTTRDRDNDRWSNNCDLHHSFDYRAVDGGIMVVHTCILMVHTIIINTKYTVAVTSIYGNKNQTDKLCLTRHSYH